MTTQMHSEAPATETTTAEKNLGELDFADYEAARLAGRSEVAPESEAELEDKTSERKNSSDSDPEGNDDGETEDGADEEESEDGSESKESETGKAKKKGGFHRRIAKLNAQKAEAQREAEYWKAQATKGAGDSKNQPVETKPKSPEGKPNPDDFETHAEYIEALTDWKTDQKLQDRDRKFEESKKKAAEEKALESHSERVKAFSEKTPDFAELLESVDGVQVSPAVEDLIISSEHGPELMYELAKNFAEFERINQLPPLAAAREMGKLEAKLLSKSSTVSETKKTTNAPNPIAPVGKGGSGVFTKSIDDPNISFADYERIRLKQLKAKG